MREQALKLFTLDSAYAEFAEGQKGSLEVGKLADFIVVDRDPLACPVADIPHTQVRLTVIGGIEVFTAP
jgi:predicted amidohydrolase YtcJ